MEIKNYSLNRVDKMSLSHEVDGNQNNMQDSLFAQDETANLAAPGI